MKANIVSIITHAPHLAAGYVTIEALPIPEHPGLITKTRRLTQAFINWSKAGLPIAPRSLRNARLAACESCEYWKPDGNLGWAECQAPGCGCSKFKVYLLTEICPHPLGSRWPRI